MTASQTSAICAMPARITPKARSVPYWAPVAVASSTLNSGDAKLPRTSAPIRMIFSRTGAAAAATKRPEAFRTPDNKAASEMNRM